MKNEFKFINMFVSSGFNKDANLIIHLRYGGLYVEIDINPQINFKYRIDNYNDSRTDEELIYKGTIENFVALYDSKMFRDNEDLKTGIKQSINYYKFGLLNYYNKAYDIEHQEKSLLDYNVLIHNYSNDLLHNYAYEINCRYKAQLYELIMASYTNYLPAKSPKNFNSFMEKVRFKLKSEYLKDVLKSQHYKENIKNYKKLDHYLDSIIKPGYDYLNQLQITSKIDYPVHLKCCYDWTTQKDYIISLIIDTYKSILNKTIIKEN